MKLSTRSRYGARMMLDLAMHLNEGPVQIREIAKRQELSCKYLEQLVIPLKKARLVNSIRGPKGGHMLAKSPEDISIGQIIKALEGGFDLTDCVTNDNVCQRSSDCMIRNIWIDVTSMMYQKLDSVSLLELIQKKKQG